MELVKDILIGNSIPIDSESARLMIAQRMRQLRLQSGWTQAELARRSGIPWETYRRFESNGQLQLSRLCRVAMALGRLGDFKTFLEPPALASLEQYDRLTSKMPRRGRRQRRSQPPPPPSAP